MTWSIRRLPVLRDTGGPPVPGEAAGDTAAPAGTGTWSATGPQAPEPGADSPGSGTGMAGVIARTGAGHAARIARTGTRRAGGTLGRLARTPGTVAHAVANCSPLTIAEHAERARNRTWVPAGQDPGGSLGTAGEVQMRTIGRVLKYAGTAISRLADNPVAQWTATAVLALVIIAVWRLVF